MDTLNSKRYAIEVIDLSMLEKYKKFWGTAYGKDVLIAEVDGEEIRDKDDFISQIKIALGITWPSGHNWDAFLEDLCRLDWIEADHVVIVIKRAHQMFRRNRSKQEQIYLDFMRFVLANWAYGVGVLSDSEEEFVKGITLVLCNPTSPY